MNNQFLPLGGRSHASLASRRTGGQEVAMAPLATRAGNEVFTITTRAFFWLKAPNSKYNMLNGRQPMI